MVLASTASSDRLHTPSTSPNNSPDNSGASTPTMPDYSTPDHRTEFFDDFVKMQAHIHNSSLRNEYPNGTPISISNLSNARTPIIPARQTHIFRLKRQFAEDCKNWLNKDQVTVTRINVATNLPADAHSSQPSSLQTEAVKKTTEGEFSGSEFEDVMDSLWNLSEEALSYLDEYMQGLKKETGKQQAIVWIRVAFGKFMVELGMCSRRYRSDTSPVATVGAVTGFEVN